MSLSKIGLKFWDKATQKNINNILSLLEKNSNALFIDLGCGGGDLTLKVAESIGTKFIYGVEIVDQRIEEAKSKGIIVEKCDLNNKLPFPDNFFDVVFSNQVIEHLILHSAGIV